MLSDKKIREKRKSFDGTDHEIANIFKTLSDTNRCKIFRLLASEPQLTVSTTAKVLNISVPLTSQHLKILLHNRLLEKDKVGRNTFYRLKRNYPVALSILNAIKQSAKHLNGNKHTK